MVENLLVIERIGVQSELTLIDVKGTHVYRLSIRNGMGGDLTKVETVPTLPTHSQRSTIRPQIPDTGKGDCESHTLTARDGNGTYCMRRRRWVFELCRRKDTRWTWIPAQRDMTY